MFTLRDGTVTEDKRLDRIKRFDERSREFSVADILAGKKHRSYTWRCLQHLNQGGEGACVGFGVTHELIARPAEVSGLGYGYALELYREAQKVDPWEGEDYEGTSVLAGVRVARVLGWMDGYYWAFNLNDLILGLGYKGPAVLGVAWFGDMIIPDSKGYIHPTGGIFGGHCILCKSVNIPKRRFTLHNSWGIGWGRKGDCYISFDDMETLLYEDGEAVFFVGRQKEV